VEDIEHMNRTDMIIGSSVSMQRNPGSSVYLKLWISIHKKDRIVASPFFVTPRISQGCDYKGLKKEHIVVCRQEKMGEDEDNPVTLL
jgi:hypothetical protein